MNRKIIFIVVIVFVVLVLGQLLWWAMKPASVLQQAKGADMINVAAIGDSSTLDFIAKEKSYFTEHNLDVALREYTSSPTAMVDLLANRVDFTIGSDFLGVGSIFADPHVRIIAQVSKRNTLQLVARKDKGIRVPSDLKGKRIGLTRKGAGEYFLGQFLALNNMTIQDVVLVNLPSADTITQIKTGQIDAAITGGPTLFDIQKGLGKNSVSWPAQGGVPINILVYTTDTFINKNPDVVRRYVASLLEAEKYVQTKPSDARNFIAQKLNYQKDYISSSWLGVNPVVALDQALIPTLENQARWAIANKITAATKVPNYLNYIYFDALQSVKPEAVTIIH